MLSEVEITYFRSRIDDVLRDDKPTAWQRQFLINMRGKIDRYGTKTRFSEKQLGMLRRLTRLEGTADKRVISIERYLPRVERKFGGRRQLKFHRWRYQELKWIIILVVIALVGIGQLFSLGTGWLEFSNTPPFSPQSSISAQQFTVTDGDTVRMADGTSVRLVGFNTPEKFEPMCAREAELGNRASERLRQLVASGTTTMTKVACACVPGTEGTSRCNFGRSCGILRINGQDVAQALIAEGLAVSFQCGRTQCPKLPRPWCG